MDSRRADGPSDPSKRGQSAILGLVLLIGMVATISVGILLVSGDVMTSTEQRAETEHIEQSFVEMSQQMATVAADGDASRSMTFDAGEKGAIVKTDTAYINISGNGVDESIRVGAVEYEGDDGTRLAYQAGGVFRETGAETQVVSEPPLEYDQRTHTFSFPVVELDEETTLSSGDVQFDRTNNTEYTDSTYIEESPIRVNITSEYCVGWQTYFEEETNQINGKAVQETCSEGEQDTLRVELGRMDIAEGTFEEGIVAGNVSGDTEDVDIVEKDGEIPPALDPMINRMVSEMKDNDSVTDLSDVGDTATSGTYYAESATISDELTFDLKDGNATLVVEEELIVDGGSLTVENWDQPGTDHALQIYVKDGMHVDGGNGEMCVAPCTSGEVDSEQLQVYGTSETHMAIGTGKAYFEGVMYAPGDGTFDETNDYINKEGQLVIQSNGDMDGSIVVSSAHIQSNAPEGMYDPSLETFSPEISPEGYVLPPKLSYLNIAKHTIEVENT